MRQLSHDTLHAHPRHQRATTIVALWANDGVERAGLFVLLCLFWGVVLYLALQSL
jgi:hypothetical protein